LGREGFSRTFITLCCGFGSEMKNWFRLENRRWGSDETTDDFADKYHYDRHEGTGAEILGK